MKKSAYCVLMMSGAVAIAFVMYGCSGGVSRHTASDQECLIEVGRSLQTAEIAAMMQSNSARGTTDQRLDISKDAASLSQSAGRLAMDRAEAVSVGGGAGSQFYREVLDRTNALKAQRTALSSKLIHPAE